MLGSVGAGLGGAIGGIAVLAGAAGRGGRKEYKQALNVWKKLQESDFDMSTLTAPELRMFAEYFPEEYSAVVPQEVALAGDSPVGRQAQLEGLGYFTDLRERGLPLATRLALQEAQGGIASEQARGQEAIMESLQRRGRLGGGTEIASRIGQDQQAMELARNLGSDIARQEILARLSGAQQAAGLGSDIRRQDIGLNMANANAINNFNQWISQLQTGAAAQNAGARERAQFQNVGNQQRIGEQNRLMAYQTDLENINRQNMLRDQLFQQQLAKAQGLTSAYGNLALDKYAQQRAKAENIQNIGQGLGGALGSGIGLGLG